MAKPKSEVSSEERAEKVAAVEEIEEIIEITDEPMEVSEESVQGANDDTTLGKVTKAGKHSAKALAVAEAEEIRKQKAKDKPDAEPIKIKQQIPNPRKRHGKNYRKVAELVDKAKLYELTEAIELAKSTSPVKFDASLELHVNLGVDPRQADQMVRASVVLPAGTGKSLRVAVLVAAAKHAEVKQVGADLVGEDDLLAKIEKGQINFDRLITTPDMMPKLAKLAKILGPKGLMPNPKSGTVTSDVAKAVVEAKAGKVEFRIDKQAIIHQAIGKVSFKNEDLLTNAKTLINAVMKAKPGAAKGTYVKAIAMTTSMGPGIKLNIPKTLAESNPKTK